MILQDGSILSDALEAQRRETPHKPGHVQPLQHHNQQSAMLALFRLFNCYVGNLQPIPGVFPDYLAPVIRNAEAATKMTLIGWGISYHNAVASQSLDGK